MIEPGHSTVWFWLTLSLLTTVVLLLWAVEARVEQWRERRAVRRRLRRIIRASRMS